MQAVTGSSGYSDFVGGIIDRVMVRREALYRLIERYFPEGLSEEGIRNLWTFSEAVRMEIEGVEGEIVCYKNSSYVRVREIVRGIHLGSCHYLDDLTEGRSLDGYPVTLNPKVIITLCWIPWTKLMLMRERFQTLGITHVYVHIEDEQEGFEQNKGRFFEILKAFYTAASQNHQVLIHCQVGISRSPSLLALFFAELSGKPFPIAHKFIRSIHVDAHEIYISAPEWFGEEQGKPNFPYLMQEYYKQMTCN